jgi:hypothetical protein
MITLKQAEQALANREQFNAGNLRAEWQRWSSGPVYVVFSYQAEIAQKFSDGKRVILSSAYDHSQTTSKHANIVRRAWGLDQVNEAEKISQALGGMLDNMKKQYS